MLVSDPCGCQQVPQRPSKVAVQGGSSQADASAQMPWAWHLRIAATLTWRCCSAGTSSVFASVTAAMCITCGQAGKGHHFARWIANFMRLQRQPAAASDCQSPWTAGLAPREAGADNSARGVHSQMPQACAHSSTGHPTPARVSTTAPGQPPDAAISGPCRCGGLSQARSWNHTPRPCLPAPLGLRGAQAA